MARLPPSVLKETGNQHDSTDERDENDSAQPAEGHAGAELPEDPSADKCADDPDDDVADEPKSRSAHDERREKAGDESDDQPGQYVHCRYPLSARYG